MKKQINEDALKNAIKEAIKSTLRETTPDLNAKNGGFRYSINGDTISNPEEKQKKEHAMWRFINRFKQLAIETLGLYMKEGRFRNLGEVAPWTADEIKQLGVAFDAILDIRRSL